VITLFLLQALGSFNSMSDTRVSEDVQQGIPAINDPAAVAQDQYSKMGQGAAVGAGSGAALGGAPCRLCSRPGPMVPCN
jgi:N-acetylmuramic acid 6-phosphate (MurNAc-6-P) etherase